MNTLLINTSDQAYYTLTDLLELKPTAKAELSGDYNVFIIDNSVNILSVNMPLKQDKQIERALPFALEESISSDIEDTHIKYIGKQSGLAYAAVIDKDLIRRISENDKFTSVSFLPACLPGTSNGITIVIIRDIALVRVNSYHSFCVPVSLLENSLAAIIQSDKKLTDIAVCDSTPNKEGKVDHLLLLQLENLQLTVRPLTNHEVFEGIRTANTKNTTLLTGEFKRAKKKSNVQISKFKSAALLTSILMFLSFLIAQTYVSQTDNKTAAVQKASIDFYKKLFPNEVVRPRLMRRQFNDYIKQSAGVGQGNGAFTTLLGDTAQEVISLNGIQFSAIKYSDKNQLLEVSLICKTVNQLEQLKQKLTDKGLQVDIASANESGNAIKGVLKVKSNG